MSYPELMKTSATLLLALLAFACVDTSRGGDSNDDGAGGAGTGGDGAATGGGDSGDQAPTALDCGTLAPTDETIVLGYVPTWIDFAGTTERLDFDTFTHVAIAFANPIGLNDAIVLEVSDEEVAALVDRAHENGAKVIISIAGASHSSEVREHIEPGNVDAFVAELDAFVEHHRFDGVDVDIEGNSVDETYEPFVTKLAAVLRPKGKLLTSAVGAWFAGEISDRAMWCFDFINVMSYDYAGTWSDAGDHSTYANAEKDLNYWTGRGYAASRTVLGVPFYGYCWGEACNRAYTPFREIAANYPEKTGQDWIAEGGVQISLNGTATIEKKATLARDYGGIMIWEVTQDTSDAMLFNALKAGLEAP